MQHTIQGHLADFSWLHYEFINQIFGDPAVRVIVAQLFAPCDSPWSFGVETSQSRYGGHHHILVDTHNGNIWCSKKRGLQNDALRPHDTLCQTYTLMKYLGVPMVGDRKQVQLAAVAMYRNILRHRQFEEQLIAYLDTHIIFSVSGKSRRQRPSRRTPTSTIKRIHCTLQMWEEFGYLHFC